MIKNANVSALFLTVLMIAFNQCVMPNQFTVIAPGPWRAVLKLEGKLANPIKSRKELFKASDEIKIDEVTEGELPFVFEVTYVNQDSFYIEIINGEERILADHISYGHDISNGNDTIRIEFPVYESYIRAVYEDQVIEGEWVVKTRENYRIPFVAKQGENHRFTTLRKTPKIDMTGKWEVYFEVETENPYPAIGEFKQEGNRLTGTFLTETGDYRFLEGTVQDDKVYLSCFDGSHAFLFEAKIAADNSLYGVFWSGKHYKTSWTATKNPNFELTDAYELTYLKEGFDKFEFTFKDPSGKIISSTEQQFQGKAKIIQIFGTWCPNCRDETTFLTNFYNSKPAELEVIALAFEKHRNFEKAAAAINRYKKQFDINYPMLIAGYADKQEASEILPMLNKVISFPTLIFLDKEDRVRKIHTGFSGPATSKYQDFITEFDEIVKIITSE